MSSVSKYTWANTMRKVLQLVWPMLGLQPNCSSLSKIIECTLLGMLEHHAELEPNISHGISLFKLLKLHAERLDERGREGKPDPGLNAF
jgi:hypothetical protein